MASFIPVLVWSVLCGEYCSSLYAAPCVYLCICIPVLSTIYKSTQAGLHSPLSSSTILQLQATTQKRATLKFFRLN
ncbi:hypothetical protein P8452_36259 [Trifolium repens]|nr:hypothetical protein P8452_36259 [Trifolium repens]